MTKLFLILIASPLLATATPIRFDAKEKIIGRAAQWRRPSQQRSQHAEVIYGRVNLSGYGYGTPTRTSRQSGYRGPPSQKERQSVYMIPPQKGRKLVPVPTHSLIAHI
jgi:hypothetical protein